VSFAADRRGREKGCSSPPSDTYANPTTQVNLEGGLAYRWVVADQQLGCLEDRLLLCRGEPIGSGASRKLELDAGGGLLRVRVLTGVGEAVSVGRPARRKRPSRLAMSDIAVCTRI
jgi:hypothetical protein